MQVVGSRLRGVYCRRGIAPVIAHIIGRSVGTDLASSVQDSGFMGASLQAELFCRTSSSVCPKLGA